MQDVQSNSQLNQASSGPNGDGAPDPLAKLYRMSTTAGVGTQEYVAINPTAIAALLLGFGSIVVLLSNILFVIPVVGVICAIIGIVQVRRSNQTQTGLGLAVFGLLLCVGVSAARVGYQAISRSHMLADQNQIGQVLHEFGQAIGAEQYEKAYQLCDDRFRERVPLATFANTFHQFRNVGPIGGVRSIEWNHQSMAFEDQPGTDNAYGQAMVFYQFEKDPTPRRLPMGFEKADGVWRINDIEMIFPTKKQ